jgi:HSP20 family protein
MPWDPVRDLLTMQERLESLFGTATPGWVPAADLCETGDRYILTMEVPGLRRDEVQLDVRGDTLTIRGQRPAQASCPGRYHQLERGQGQFCRSFRFTLPVSADAIAAELTDGVLTVTVPKATPTEARRIDVE